jgi:two-component system OmpR family response regulator
MRILVVEDGVKLAHLLRRGLVEEGYAVDVVNTGVDGVWMGAEHDYDAMILDIGLRDVDGFEVCRRLRARSRWAPILFLTARDAYDDRVRGLDCGADDYVTKPFSFPELLARLRALLRRGHQERPTVLTVGDLRLDPATRLVRRAEAPIDLTAKEYALLECFVRHPGQVLSRAELLEHVWDDRFDGDPRVVNVYIGYLREKIDRPFGRHSLQTLRGVGYRLRDDLLRDELAPLAAG